MTAAVIDRDKAKKAVNDWEREGQNNQTNATSDEKPQTCDNDDRGEFNGSMREKRNIRVQQNERQMSPGIRNAHDPAPSISYRATQKTLHRKDRLRISPK